MKWLLAPVSTVMEKLIGGGAVCTADIGWSVGAWCDVRKEKPTPAGGVDAAGADPGDGAPSGLYELLMVVGGEALFAWPKLA